MAVLGKRDFQAVFILNAVESHDFETGKSRTSHFKSSFLHIKMSDVEQFTAPMCRQSQNTWHSARILRLRDWGR